MKKVNRLLYLMAAMLAVAFCLITLKVNSGMGKKAYAANGLYSSVISDLIQDKEFNFSAYAENTADNSLQVIQIAESTDGELLIYVYQPSGQTKNLRASSINISRYADNATSTSFKNYRLEFCNSYGTLCKYKVIGFELLKTAQRVYNVSNILRPFDYLIGDEPGADNTVSEVPNAVGQCWTATNENGKVTYSMTASEVIEIKNKHVGYINYDDGNNIGWAVSTGATSAHFVAFSTNKPMDKLKSASLTFNERDVQYKYCCNVTHFWHGVGTTFDYVYGEPTAHEPNPLTLHYTEKASNASGGYVWNRIQKTSDFLKDKTDDDITLTNQAEGELAKTQWVLNFYETPVLVKSDNVWLPVLVPIANLFTGDADVKKTEVSDVMILQLEFEYQGKTYKLGTVDNKQTGSQKPDGSTKNESADFWTKAWRWLKSYWWVIPVGLICIVVFTFALCSLLKFVFKMPLGILGKCFTNTGANKSTAKRSKTTKAKTSRGKNRSRGKKK